MCLTGETRRGRIQGGAPLEKVRRCRYDEATITGAELLGRCEEVSLRDAVLERPRATGSEARLSDCDLLGVRVEGGSLEDLSLVDCNLREARIFRTEVGELQSCDLYGATLERVRIHRALSTDFRATLLSGCDLRGANLKGSTFARAEFRGCKLDDAQVEGVDFTGARGLDQETRRTLVEEGAILGGAHLHRWLRRLTKADDPWRLHRMTLGIRGGALLFTVLLLTWFAWSLYTTTQEDDENPQRASTLSPTPGDRETARSGVLRLREGLEHAHELMQQNGAVNRAWPTVRDLRENRFDMDGDAPEESWDLLLKEGLPENPLTISRGGVTLYCADEPAQEGLRGLETDWYYCELNGRIFAAAGGTQEATLNW